MKAEALYKTALRLVVEIPFPKQGKGCGPMADYVLEMRLANRVVNRLFNADTMKQKKAILGELQILVDKIKESD